MNKLLKEISAIFKPKKKKKKQKVDTNINENVTDVETSKNVSSEEKKKRRFKKRLQELIIKTLILIVGIVLLLTVFFSIHIIRGNDMYPSLRDGDLVITYRLVNIYMADHVFEYKVDGQRHYGRIVGVAGDRIEFDGKGYYKVNGNVPYEDQFYKTEEISSSGIKFPYKVPEDSVFILSDYRIQSEDSRVFGAIPIKDLVGEVVLQFRRRGF